jgi:hypothetical protein
MSRRARIDEPGGLPRLVSREINQRWIPLSLQKGKFAMEPRPDKQAERRLTMEKLERRIAPSSGNFPPGQFPSGNPAHAPGNSNPNEVPSSH